jgi:aquaporin related protein
MSLDGPNAKDPELGFPRHEASPTASPNNRKHENTVRTELTAFIGEFIGTFMFLSLAFVGTQIALNATSPPQLTSNKDTLPTPDVGKLLYIAINVAIFADISGGKFNPAVSPA